jgi:glycosyltransferase involved in cell wall biosynthesis
LLVDDGSDDGGGEIARTHAARLPHKVRCLEHPDHQNRGMSASRNLGIRQAAGDYLAFPDADDMWLPRKLERQLSLIASQPEAGMVYGKTEYWYSWTGEPDDVERDYVQEHGIPGDVLLRPPAPLSLFLSGRAAVPCSYSILVSRGAIESSGGFEDSFRGLYEDQAFYAKICLDHPVFVSNECLERYRQHPDSICSASMASERDLTSRQRYLEWQAGYLASRGISDHDPWQTLQRELWLVKRPGVTFLPERMHVRIRWSKKWLLRFEDLVLPPAVRCRLWARRVSGSAARGESTDA